VGSSDGGLPHTPGRLLPQIRPSLHAPQSRAPPQPSPISPQYRPPPPPAMMHVTGTQPGEKQVPPWQDWPPAHGEQRSSRPQPSPIRPQYLGLPPAVQVSGMQLAPPTQTPALQTSLAAQAPHSSLPPGQPVPIVPQ